jgi:hypothetical protein
VVGTLEYNNVKESKSAKVKEHRDGAPGEGYKSGRVKDG